MSSHLQVYLASTPDRLARLARALPDAYRRTPGRAVAAAALLGLAGAWLRRNYVAFVALGPGGLPHDVRGWLGALALKLFARETTSTGEYARDADTRGWIEGREGVPRRRGARPASGFHVVPARQLDQVPDGAMMLRLDELFARVVRLNPGLVELNKSPHESVHDGILVRAGVPPAHDVVRQALREVAHIHPSDHSMHVLLAPQDCKLVIERGWGERHGLSGSRGLRALPVFAAAKLPKEYIWIYAPRDEQELAVVEKILVGAVRYMTGTQDIKH